MNKIGTALCSLWLLAPTFAAAASPCDNFTQDTTKQVIDIFHDTNKTEAQKRTELVGVFEQAVDTDWIGRFVLGRFWRTASADEQQEYLKSYRNYVTTSYVSKFKEEDGINVQEIKLVSLTPQQSGEFLAKTLIRIKDEPEIHVDYTLTEVAGSCKVHNIVVEGVSLLISQRSEFQTMANSVGVKGIIAAMQKKVAAK